MLYHKLIVNKLLRFSERLVILQRKKNRRYKGFLRFVQRNSLLCTVPCQNREYQISQRKAHSLVDNKVFKQNRN